MRQNRGYSLANGETTYQSPRLFEVFSRQIGALIGVVLLVVVGACGAALVTWNAADPSLSFANQNPVTNILGYPGAIYADLSMQFFGLASVGLLLPVFFWAILLLAHRSIRPLLRRLLFWVISALSFSGLVALVPPFAHWPMPIGLGGVIGDKLLVFSHIFLDHFPITAFVPVMSVILVPLTLWSIMLAGGVIGRRPKRKRKVARADNPVNSDGDEIDFSRPGLLVTLSGHLMHICLRLASFYRLIFRRHRPRDFQQRISVRHNRRMEPGFSDAGEDNHTLNDETADKTSKKTVRRASKVGSYEFPRLDYLTEPPMAVRDPQLSDEFLQKNAVELEGVLEDFGIKGQILQVRPGPIVTLYEFEPAPGIKSSRVIGLADDIARSMSAVSARVAVLPGRNAIGIELPNPTRETVYLREILQAREFRDSRAKLAFALGKTIGGEAVIADLAKMPHLLVAGTTGSGKSVAINTMILSLLYRLTPDQCRLIMVDPKMLELSVYDGIPHLLTPVVTDPKKAVVALKWAVREMEDRYRKMAKVGVRNIDGFNLRVKEAAAKGETLSRTVQTGFDAESGQPVLETEAIDTQPLPYIVVIIDEMADLMMVAGKDIEGAIQRLAQMARAAGIHVVMATQRPSVDVITGTIKANFPTRISFSVTSKIDSRTILGEQGAEQLLGQGDMLFMLGGGRIQRVHGPFVGDDEVEEVVAHLKAQGIPDYLEDITLESDDDGVDYNGQTNRENSDDPYDQAVAVVLRDRKVSTSYIQRRLGIGYNRAASLVERMEEEGLISPANHAGKREILVPEDGSAM